MNSESNKYTNFPGELSEFYDRLLANPDWPFSLAHDPEELTELSQQLHFYNSSLWNEEDLARRNFAPDAEIVKNKRVIDRFNQLRNNHIELIDDFILTKLGRHDIQPESMHRSSETAGSMFDRISIVSLKIFHMSKQTVRIDVNEEHRTRAAAKVEILREQRKDLTESLHWLMSSLSEGKAYFKLYRQFKMYNDPSLNPALVAEGKGSQTI